MEEDALRAALTKARRSGESRRPLAPAFAAIQAMQRPPLWNWLEEAWSTLEPLEALDGVVAPLLWRVGETWADGTLGVHQEHFATAVVSAFLSARGRLTPGTLRLEGPMPQDDNAPTLVATTLEGELHGLGLEMVALVARSAGWRVIQLGPNTPRANTLAACGRDVDALIISTASSRPWVKARRELVRLREALPGHVQVLVGGSGTRSARRAPQGVTMPGHLRALHAHLVSLTRPRTVGIRAITTCGPLTGISKGVETTRKRAAL